MHLPVLPKYPVTQDFGETEFSKQHGKEVYSFFDGKHPGLDFAMPIGEPVFAALPGYVTSLEFHRGMGKTIRIRFGSIQHIYGHLSQFQVDFGDYIQEGQPIALSGDTVVWTEPHLHFEIRDLTIWEVKDRPFDPDFNVNIPTQYQESFTYVVNHQSAVIDLALKFYGNEQGIQILPDNNSFLDIANTHQPLPFNTKVLIY